MPPKSVRPVAAASAVDSVVQKLIEKIDARKKAIRAVDNPQWKTNQLFTYRDGDLSNATNIKTVSDIGTLLKMAAYLGALHDRYVKTTEDFLGIDAKRVPAFTWSGFPYGAWIHDLKLRVDCLRVTEQAAELRDWEGRLDLLISPEEKRRLMADQLAREIGE